MVFNASTASSFSVLSFEMRLTVPSSAEAFMDEITPGAAACSEFTSPACSDAFIDCGSVMTLKSMPSRYGSALPSLSFCQ